MAAFGQDLPAANTQAQPLDVTQPQVELGPLSRICTAMPLSFGRRFKALAIIGLEVAGRVPFLRDALIAVLQRRSGGTPLGRKHPFDRRHGVDTSGTIPGSVLRGRTAVAYAAAQPSIIRGAIAALPDISASHFVDLGCGKGRPLLVASTCGFRAVTGVEYSPTLARIARRNAAVFADRSPTRVPITVVTGDAAGFALPVENLVVFFYNPFATSVMAQVLANIERSLAAAPRDLFVIAYNPVAAPLFDASPVLQRYFAATLPYASEELGFGPDRDDAVAIWCNRGHSQARLAQEVAPIQVLSPMRAVLV